MTYTSFLLYFSSNVQHNLQVNSLKSDCKLSLTA